MTTPHAPLPPLELSRRMTPSDAMFWYSESALPQLRPIIAGLYVLDGHPRPGGIESALANATRIVPRLRQRVVEAPLALGLPEYVDDPHYDLDYHLRHLSLPGPGSTAELLEMAAAVIATPMDRQRPLWESYWIDGFEHGRSVFLFKMHHALVDGVGSMAITRGLTRTSADAEYPRLEAGSGSEAPPVRSLLAEWAETTFDAALDTARLAWWAAGAPLRALSDPRAAIEQGKETVEGLVGMLADVGQQPIEDPLARSAAGLSRRLDVAAVSIDRLRAIKAPLGVTLNDLILAALAGAVGRYHDERGAPMESVNCMVPMNLRARDEKDDLGNRVGMINVRLPLAERDPKRRLERIVEQTRRAKDDRRGTMFPMLAKALPIVPGPVFSWIARQALGRVNLACTNVPGLPGKVFLGGAEVTAIYPFASPVEGTPLVMALLSYDGRMDIGISADPEAIPDPERITALFHEALDELEEAAATAVTA